MLIVCRLLVVLCGLRKLVVCRLLIHFVGLRYEYDVQTVDRLGRGASPPNEVLRRRLRTIAFPPRHDVKKIVRQSFGVRDSRFWTGESLQQRQTEVAEGEGPLRTASPLHFGISHLSRQQPIFGIVGLNSKNYYCSKLLKKIIDSTGENQW